MCSMISMSVLLKLLIFLISLKCITTAPRNKSTISLRIGVIHKEVITPQSTVFEKVQIHSGFAIETVCQ